MKKMFFLYLFIFLMFQNTKLFGDIAEFQNSCKTVVFSSGYVFKNDNIFREVYGYGVGNILTADFCYYRWNTWGIGAKASYWLAVGRTTSLRKSTVLQEIPITFYVRKIFDTQCGLRTYASLGGGFAWIGEHSYLGNVSQARGLGEVEIGIHYPFSCRRAVFSTALRYLFPPQKQGFFKADVGGIDLRAGFGFYY